MMPAEATDLAQFYFDTSLPEPEVRPFASGVIAVYTTRCPDKETPNEDAIVLVECTPDSGVLAVADGFGGQPAGEQAARVALQSLVISVRYALANGGSLRDGILDGFDSANRAVNELGIGAATTLVALEIDAGRVRSFHVGDSTALIVGQRGKLKLQTVSHSPVGYAVEAGWLPEEEALHHEELHIVSNMVGSPEMRIEMGPNLRLGSRDTVLLGSDGLFDNLPSQQVAEVVRKGPLSEAASLLAAECDRRMQSPEPGQASKPDDLAVVLFRMRDCRPRRAQRRLSKSQSPGLSPA